VREVSDASVLADPRRRGGEVGGRAYEIERILVYAEGEKMPVRLSGEKAAQLGARNHEQPVRRVRLRSHPVIRDSKNVEIGPLVVADELLRRQLAVGARRVRVEGAPNPRSGGRKRI